MEIQVARLREVMALMKPVILRKPTLQVLTNVLFKDGQAVATDMDTMVVVPVPEADETCLLPYNELLQMIQYVQAGDQLKFTMDGRKVTLEWSDGSSVFYSANPEEYPAIPEFMSVAEAPMDVDTLIPAMCEVKAFASTDEARPTLAGVTLVLGEECAVGAGDGFRMAYKILSLSFPKEATMVLPLSSVNALKLLKDKTPRTPPLGDELIPILMSKKQASVSIDDNRGLRFVFGDKTVAILKLVQGDPPTWLKLLPKDAPELKVSLIGAQLEVAVRRILPVAGKGENIARLTFDGDTLTVSAVHAHREAQSTVHLIITDGAPSKVGINAGYLLSYLKGREGIVTISLGKEGTPVAFHHQHSPSVLIMPMKVDWDLQSADPGEPVAEAEEQPEAEKAVVEEPEKEPAKTRKSRTGKAKKS